MPSNKQSVDQSYSKFNGLRHLADQNLHGGDHAKAARFYVEALRNWPVDLRAVGNAKYQAVLQGLQMCRQHPKLTPAPSLRENGGFRPTGIWARLYVNAVLRENEWGKWVDMALANQMKNAPQFSTMMDAVTDNASMCKSWEYVPGPSGTFSNEYAVRAQGFVLSVGVEARAAWITSFTDTGKLQLGSEDRPEEASMALVTILAGDELT